MQEKWRVIGSTTVVRDRWINVRADHCVTPAGDELNPFYVLSYPDWVHVVALTDANQLVLVRQYRHGAGDFILELPGGAADSEDGSLNQTARRELEEETGFTARHWQHIASLQSNPATHTNRVHFLLAQGAVSDGKQRLDAGEAGLQVELVDIPTVLAGLQSGLIDHAMHASGVLLGLAAAGKLRLAAG